MKHISKIVLCVLLTSVSACSANRSGSGAGDNQDMSDDMLMGSGVSGLGTIHFDFDSAELSSDAKETLKSNSAWFAKNRASVVNVEGHCDERGTTEYNLALGERRAQSTIDFLTALGVSPEQVRPVSFGEERPVATGSDESAYMQNRRAAFTANK